MISLLLLALLTSTSSSEAAPRVTSGPTLIAVNTNAVDADDDGVLSGTDCDDDDPDVGAARTQWLDADGDGYGDPAHRVSPCADYGVTNALDCDDSDPYIHPGAREICNDWVDDDCDGQADDDDDDTLASTATTWYADVDGDGYGGDLYTTYTRCYEPTGYSDVDGDCDDTDAEVYPGTEGCACAQ